MNFQIDKSQKVLVTRATGFVASWIVKQLLDVGVSVNATVRDSNDKNKVVHLLEMSKRGHGDVILFQANLLQPGSFNDSIAGCSIVFHTASPFLLKFNDGQKDLMDPAMNGTQNVLKAVNSVSSIERVVLTSSCAAIYGDADECKLAPNGMLNEDIWNTTSLVTHQPYSYSKTVAKRKAS